MMIQEIQLVMTKLLNTQLLLIIIIIVSQLPTLNTNRSLQPKHELLL